MVREREGVGEAKCSMDVYDVRLLVDDGPGRWRVYFRDGHLSQTTHSPPY